MKKSNLHQSDNIWVWVGWGYFGLLFGYSIVNPFSNFLWNSIKEICFESLQREQYKMVLDLYPYVILFNILFGLIFAALIICVKLIYHHVKKPKEDEATLQNN